MFRLSAHAGRSPKLHSFPIAGGCGPSLPPLHLCAAKRGTTTKMRTERGRMRFMSFPLAPIKSFAVAGKCALRIPLNLRCVVAAHLVVVLALENPLPPPASGRNHTTFGTLTTHGTLKL